MDKEGATGDRRASGRKEIRDPLRGHCLEVCRVVARWLGPGLAPDGSGGPGGHFQPRRDRESDVRHEADEPRIIKTRPEGHGRHPAAEGSRREQDTGKEVVTPTGGGLGVLEGGSRSLTG